MASRSGKGLYALATALTGILVWTALGNGLVFGQGFSAAVSGVVRDATGAVVPEAAITVRNVETGLTRTAEGDASGSYHVPSLPVGPYELTVEKPGFKQQVRMGITLVVAQEAVVNFTLEVGNVQQVVEVTGEAPLVNTTLASTSGLITEGQIKDMPLNGRSFDQLLLLNVGTANNSSNIQNNAWTAFSVAGKRPETNRFLINGIDYVGTNAGFLYVTPSGSSGQLLGVDAVREYNVLPHTYGAEYGKRAGGQISIVTSSGTNQLHGSAFEYLRNSALDARNFFDVANAPAPTPVPPFKRNQFGGSLGGPLKRDKAFLFGNYEGFRQRLGISSAAIVPDAEVRRGLLPCYLATPAACPGTASLAARSASVPVPDFKPGMLPYAQHFWPEPNGPELLVDDPAPGGCKACLPSGTVLSFSNPAQKIREEFGLARFDYTLSGKDSFSTNYTMDDGERAQPERDPVFVSLTTQRAQTLAWQETHVFSPTLLSVATFGFSRALGSNVVAPTVPIPANLVFLSGGLPGTLVIGGGALAATPSALVPAPGNNPVRAVRNHYTWSDDLRLVRGRHSWSAGGWMQRIQINPLGAGQTSAGSLSYSTVLTFLQDRPTQFIANPNPQPLGYRTTEAAWYIQDEIKLRPNLTVRLGLRDEMTNGWNEVVGRCANYFFDQNGVILTDPHIGPSCLKQNNAKALWQPRVGVAWDPTGTGTWAVRAGFGIHNDLQDNLSIRMYTTAPFNARMQLNAPLLSPAFPFPLGTQPPPSCTAVGQTNCSIFAPAGVEPSFRAPTVQQWSFTVEREIRKDLMVQLSYVGAETYHILTATNPNVARPQVCSDPQGCVSGGTLANGNPYQPPPGQPPVRVPPGTTYMPPGRRPNPVVSSGAAWFFFGTSSYQSGNVSLLKRSRGGLTFKTNYTFSKVLDINSAVLSPSGTNEPGTVLNRYDPKTSRGPGSYSIQHQFNANFSYPLPFGKGQRFGSGASGWVDKLIGGWQWNGIVTAQSGFPFTPTVGSGISGTGDAGQSDVPNRNPAFRGPVIVGKVDQWFDPQAFLLPTVGTFGDLGRGAFIGPTLFTFDTSLFKKLSLNERYSLQFRAEAFNLFNRANLGEPNQIVFSGNSYSSSAGVITTTATSSRQIQFALKLLF